MFLPDLVRSNPFHLLKTMLLSKQRRWFVPPSIAIAWQIAALYQHITNLGLFNTRSSGLIRKGE